MSFFDDSVIIQEYVIGDFLNICSTLKLTMFTGSSQISFKVETADIIFLFSQMRYYYPYFSLFSKCLKTIVTPKGGCETRTQDSGPCGTCAACPVAVRVNRSRH